MSKHLITTRALPGPCPGCAEPILTGVSEGVNVRADIYPLASDLEAVALLAGRETYTLHMQMLVRRLGNSPPSYAPVLCQHVCGYVLRVQPPPDPPASRPCFEPPF